MDELKQKNALWLNKLAPDLARRIENLGDNPRLKVTPSRKGVPTLAVDDLQIHSSYDPVAEAEKLAARAVESTPAGSAIVLFGFGLGYLALAIRARFSGQIAVVEADETIFKAAFEHNSLSMLGDTTLAIGDTPVKVLSLLKALADSVGGWGKLHIVEFPPALRLDPAFYDAVAAGIRGRASSISGPLSILIATPMYGGSLPIAHYCANAFQRLGHRVETLDNSIFDAPRRQLENISRDRNHRGQLERLLTTLMSEMITAKALDRAVDLVWLVAQSPMSIPVAQEIKKHGIPTAFWFVEEWQLLTYWQEWAPLFDYFFTIQRGPFLKALADRGVKRAQYLPLAADPTIHQPLKLTSAEQREFGSQVSHVGAGYRNRRHVFSGLTCFDFKLWGNDWSNSGVLSKALQREGARLTTEESVKIFNATAVNLNLHSSQFHDGVNPDGDYLNPRTFELAACGAFQLVDFRKDLPEQFEPERELVTFRDAREIAPLIRHYLDHPAERKQIANAGRERVLRDHTYDLRMTSALDYIFSHETTRASRRHPNHIDNLLIEAKDKPDLVALLETLKGRGVVTLDDIIEQIKQSDGDLTDAETIFLLMYEFRRWAAEKDLA